MKETPKRQRHFSAFLSAGGGAAAFIFLLSGCSFSNDLWSSMIDGDHSQNSTSGTTTSASSPEASASDNGQDVGAAGGGASSSAASPVVELGATPAYASDATDRKPYVIIHFDRPHVVYESTLYTAISRALERRPDAKFDLVAVAPSTHPASRAASVSEEARRNADEVMQSLAKMGLPANRVSRSATTSAHVRSSEVQIYVR
jgi:hypothetical protein